MGFTNYTLKEINDILINYIENNNRFNGISYSESLAIIDELVNELWEEYNDILKKQNESEGK
jgi:predicted house-cleaning noncanonical NTP pyrophosphatase (MazG superfamily)